MPYVKAVFLAVLEGLTEFLPVSSTGHLILANAFMQLTPDTKFNDTFMVVIQLPAILAVVVYFWARLWPFVPDPAVMRARLTLWTKIGVAFLPAAVFGFLFNGFIEEKLFNPVTVAVALLAGGLLLLALERGRRTPSIPAVDAMGFGTALGVGFIQCVAMAPGVSRSAATIIGAMLLGASRPAAAEFSFFLAIPTMLGATALVLFKNGLRFTPEQWSLLLAGCVTSFAVAFAAVAWLMSYIQHHDFRFFGWWRIVLAAVVLALLAVGPGL